MPPCRLISIPSDFAVIDSPQETALPDLIRSRIETLWLAEKQKRGATLFNGRLFSVDRYDKRSLTGHFVDYKDYLAQMRAPELFAVLQIRPLGVSGLVLASDRALFGKRSQTVTHYPGYQELVPSGGVDENSLADGRIDCRKQLLREFAEETQADPKISRELHFFALIQDTVQNVFDLCAQIHIQNPHTLPLRPNDEYEQFFWLDQKQIRRLLQSRAPVVPTSAAILQSLRFGS